MKHPIERGTRVRFIWFADELAAKGVDMNTARGMVTGTVVPIEGEARRELERIEQVLRSGKGRHTGCHGPRCGYTPTRDDLVAIWRDDATPGLRYQFAGPEDLLPALA